MNEISKNGAFCFRRTRAAMAIGRVNCAVKCRKMVCSSRRDEWGFLGLVPSALCSLRVLRSDKSRYKIQSEVMAPKKKVKMVWSVYEMFAY